MHGRAGIILERLRIEMRSSQMPQACLLRLLGPSRAESLRARRRAPEARVDIGARIRIRLDMIARSARGGELTSRVLCVTLNPDKRIKLSAARILDDSSPDSRPHGGAVGA